MPRQIVEALPIRRERITLSTRRLDTVECGARGVGFLLFLSSVEKVVGVRDG